MKRVAFVLVFLSAACSLNPQPFPPDNPDGAISSGADGGNKNGDASTFGDAGGIEDASTDGEPVPQTDAGGDANASDASDADATASDAGDAGDAARDADAD